MTASLKYISHTDDKREPNQFYAYLEPSIHQLFISGDHAKLDSLENIYCVKRASVASAQELAALKSRMPQDILQFTERQGSSPPQFGSSELDLIDFLLNIRIIVFFVL
jgi:hypothetical protein